MGFIQGVKLLLFSTTPVTGDLLHFGTRNVAPCGDSAYSLTTAQAVLALGLGLFLIISIVRVR